MRRPGHDEWLELLKEYETSELTQKEFVAKHDLSLSTFQWWLYRKSKQKKLDSNSSARFLPVEVVASPAPLARAGGRDRGEASLRSGRVVRFGVGTDTRYLAELLAALG